MGVAYSLATRTHSWTSSRLAGRMTARMRWVVRKVALRAAARVAGSVSTCSGPRISRQALIAPARSPAAASTFSPLLATLAFTGARRALAVISLRGRLGAQPLEQGHRVYVRAVPSCYLPELPYLQRNGGRRRGGLIRSRLAHLE